MGAIQIKLSIPQLSALQTKFETAPDLLATTKKNTLTKSAIQTQALLMGNVPVRTGRLRQSVAYKVVDDMATVFIDPKIGFYGRYVESGTGLFGKYGSPIVPTTKKIMATKINPGWGSANASGYFIIGTFSRGQEANKFMERTYEQALPIIKLTFAEAAKLITQSLGDE